MVKTPPAMQETQVGFLGQENPLEKGTAIHSSILGWRIPWTYMDIIVYMWGLSIEKVYRYITYSNVLSLDYKIKSSMYLLILFKLTCLYT